MKEITQTAGTERRLNDIATPQVIHDVAPGLGTFTDTILVGEIWKRGT